MSGRPPRLALALCLGPALAASGAGAAAAAAQGSMRLLWPIHFSSAPLSTPQGSALEPPELGQELTLIAKARYEAYLSETLPKELEADPDLAAEFGKADHSRVNLAFFRWQKRVFADAEEVPPEQLSARGELAPRLEGIDYTWPELHQSSAFQRLRMRITELSRLYMRRSGYDTIPPTFRIFVWAELYSYGDALRPVAFTDGAYVMGRYFASVRKGSLKFNFEDPRGINPPYGKTFSHAAYEGNIVLFPAWTSQLITPNMHNYTAVCFAFLVYPPSDDRLDWADDKTGKMEVPRPFQAIRPTLVGR